MIQLAMKFIEYRKVVEQGTSEFEAYPMEGNRALVAIGGMCNCCDAVNIAFWRGMVHR